MPFRIAISLCVFLSLSTANPALPLPGKATAALSRPVDVAVRGEDVYVADTGLNAVVVFSKGAVVRSWSASSPTAVEVGPDGLVYVAEGKADRVSVFRPDGMLVRAFGGRALTPTPGKFFHPTALAVSPRYVWVADDSGWVQQFTLEGKFLRRFGNRLAFGGGIIVNSAGALASDLFDRLYVADAVGGKIVVVSGRGKLLKRLAPSVTGAPIDTLTGIVVSGQTIAVADAYRKRTERSGRERIVVLNGATGTALSSFGKPCPTCLIGTGSNEPGAFSSPLGLALSGGRLYVADSGNGRVQVFDTGGALVAVLG